MKVLVGGLIAGLILYIVPGLHSSAACLVAGILTSLLLSLFGPRSLVEKVGLTWIIALIAWLAGPRAATNQSLFAHLLGWTFAGAALAYQQRPKSE